MTTMIGETFSESVLGQSAPEAAGPHAGVVGLIASIGLTAILTAAQLWTRHSFAGQALKGRVRLLKAPPAATFAPYDDVQ